MAYKDLDTFFDPDLKLPIRGKTYTVPAPGAPEAARLRKQVIAEGVPPVEQVFEALKISAPRSTRKPKHGRVASTTRWSPTTFPGP